MTEPRRICMALMALAIISLLLNSLHGTDLLSTFDASFTDVADVAWIRSCEVRLQTPSGVVKFDAIVTGTSGNTVTFGIPLRRLALWNQHNP